MNALKYHWCETSLLSQAILLVLWMVLVWQISDGSPNLQNFPAKGGGIGGAGGLYPTFSDLWTGLISQSLC